MASRLRAAALALACLAVQLTQAAPPPAEVFFGNADIVEAALSPSGRQIAFTSALGAKQVSLLVFDLAPGGQTTRIVELSRGDVRDVQWVSDSRLVFNLASHSVYGHPAHPPILWAVDSDGRKPRQLMRRKDLLVAQRGDVPERILDWNHRLLTVPTQRTGEGKGEVLMTEFTADEHHTELPLWLNTRDGNTWRPTDLQAPPNTTGWLADSNGDLRVALTRHRQRQAAYWRAPASKTWQLLYESDLGDAPFTVHDVDDAGNLYVVHRHDPDGLKVLARYDFERRAPALRPLVMTPGFDFDGQLVKDGGRVLGVRLTVDGETTVWFDDTLKALQQQADKYFPGSINHIECSRCGAADMVAMVRSSSDRDPGQLWLYQAKPADGDKAWRLISPVRKDVKPEVMAEVTLHRIAARDGRDLPAWVTRAPGSKLPQPAVVLIHDGPWARGNAWGWHAEAQFLASRGYVVVEPEMRGSTGFGDAHFRAGFKQWGRAMQDDVTDALRWVQAQGMASERACIAGAGYGGYSALMGLIQDPAIYLCGVAWAAVTDLDLLVSGSWWITDDIGKTVRQYALPEMVGDPVADAEQLTAVSPVKQAGRLKAPVLLAVGETDLQVPPEHSERMRKALRDAGNAPVWATYAGEGHSLTFAKNRIDFAERVEAFLAKYLGPAKP